MRHLAAPVLLIGLAACGGGGGNVSEAKGGLTGLYEGGDGPRRNQLCLVDRGGATRFGVIVWADAGNNSCTGRGRATRDGEGLRLAMQGDETCVIEARIEGDAVILPAGLPEGCAYYCGPGVEVAANRFDRSGNSAEDAQRAVDLVGDPLCG